MKKVVTFVVSIFFVLSIFLIPGSKTLAQSDGPSEPTDTPTPIVYPTVVLPTDTAASMNLFPETPSLDQLERGENISFRLLEAKDFAMIGPYASYYLGVGIPSDWKLNRAAKLNLKVNLNVTRSNSPKEKYSTWLGPRLDVYFDETYVTSYRIVNNGDYSFNIPIPVDHMKPDRNGSHYIFLYLDAAYDCEFDQSTVLTIKSDSYFSLPHENASKKPNLNQLPVPFFQVSSFVPNPVALVVPDNATESELQAALTVAAGLGRKTTNKLALSAMPFSQVTDAIRKSSHMIYVGKAGSFPYLSSLSLPAPQESSQFNAPGAQADDGIIQMVVSPSNPGKTVMIIGGNSDAGVLKAGQAIGTGSVRATQNPQLAIISKVSPQNVSMPTVPIDQTFAALGYENVTLQGLGLVNHEFLFTLPAGFQVGEDAYLDFSYAHTDLLDYDRSSISVMLNGEQINSVPYTKEDLTNPAKPIRFTLPAYAFVPGVNSLVVEASHINTHCAYYATGDIWTTIYNKSVLHIPPAAQTDKKVVLPNLANFPKPFTNDPELTSVAFVVSPKDANAVYSAAKIAEDLGRKTNSGIITLSAYFSDRIPDDVKTSKNLIIVGKPTNLPIIAELNEFLPAGFNSSSNIADESGLSVSYRLPPEASIGYLEMIGSPWNQNQVILTALGSTEDGLKWAANTLTDPVFVTQLNGDYAVTNGTEVYTVDTQTGSGTMNIGITAVPGLAITLTPAVIAASNPNQEAANPSQSSLINLDSKVWVPYAVAILSLITLAVLVVLVIINARRKKDEEYHLGRRRQ
jgi:hypothetical protein